LSLISPILPGPAFHFDRFLTHWRGKMRIILNVARQFRSIKEIAHAGRVDVLKRQLLLGLGLVIAMAGCQSATSTAPNAALAGGPVDTGEYPKIGRIPVPETSQLGPAGTAELRSNLASARASQNTGEPGPETYAEKLRRLRKLGLAHGTETLAEIEARERP
jgi:hypothetical protein